MLKKFYLISFFYVFSIPVSGTVVLDTGKTIPLKRYFESNKNIPKKISKEAVSKLPYSVFPLVSSIDLGVLKRSKKKAKPNVNVALVGVGNISHKWLINNLKKIKRYGATIVIISAKTYEEYSKYSEYLKVKYGLAVTYGDSKAFQDFTSNYPVIITQEGLFQ